MSTCPRCGDEIAAGLLSCRGCWSLVPEALRYAVRDAWWRGQYRGRRAAIARVLDWLANDRAEVSP